MRAKVTVVRRTQPKKHILGGDFRMAAKKKAAKKKATKKKAAKKK